MAHLYCWLDGLMRMIEGGGCIVGSFVFLSCYLRYGVGTYFLGKKIPGSYRNRQVGRLRFAGQNVNLFSTSEEQNCKP